MEDELFVFSDEDPAGEPPVSRPPTATKENRLKKTETGQTAASAAPGASSESWKVLIVDDDIDVHDVTVFSLKDTVILGRPVSFLHAYSGSEGIEILRRNPDIPLVLLDAIMETEDAGLAAVRRIREELGMENIRIILRTGQPGQIPELETITRYDINDYKTKSELTRVKLITSIVAALRGYIQLVRVQSSRQGLEKIISASNRLIAQQGLSDFADGVITQMASLFDLDPEGIVCASRRSNEQESADSDFQVIAAAGRFRPYLNKALIEIDHPEITAALSEALRKKHHIVGASSLTVYFQEPNGRSYATWIGSSQPISGLDSNLLEIFCTNIALCASNVEMVSLLRQQAWEDPVLRIPNMTALLEHIRLRLLETAPGAGLEKDGGTDSLAVMDIAGFNQINDLLGHDYGDAILRSLVQKLQAILGGAYLARIAADVFAIVGRQSLFSRETLTQLSSMQIQTPDGERELAICIGICAIDADAGNASAQLRNGYVALKQAKNEGPGRIVCYSKTIGDRTRESIRLLHELRGGVQNGELFLVFQPQVLVKSKQLFCCEALIRWRKKDGSLVPPDRFIPLAEQAGLIVPIGTWVLKTALLALRRIHDAGYTEMHMAVNVSAMQLHGRDFLDHLDNALAESGVPSRFLELEITESIGASGLPEVLNMLSELQERGVSIAIDDFGTGYSSLSTIDRWPVDRIKIDRSFIANMERQQQGARLLDLVIPLANRLSLRVLAEGVETEEQLAWLQRLGCHEMQGYLISKPQELDALLNWMENYRPIKM